MISICIPAYNYAEYLPLAIDSCLSQDEDFDLIVVDNCSSDNTPELRDRYASDPRLKWFRNETLVPLHQNWNYTVSLASLPYVKLLHADDVLLPKSISKMTSLIRENPEICFFGHLAEYIDKMGNIKRRRPPYFGGKTNLIKVTGVQSLKGKLRQTVRFGEPSSNFYKKDSWESLGGYRTKLRFTGDLHFNIRMMKIFPCALCNDYLVQVRRHQASDGATLPAKLPLNDLKELVGIILAELGTDSTFLDRAAGNGWILYRLIELCLQRISWNFPEAFSLLMDNANLFLANPFTMFYTARLLRNKIFYGDPQQ